MTLLKQTFVYKMVHSPWFLWYDDMKLILLYDVYLMFNANHAFSVEWYFELYSVFFHAHCRLSKSRHAIAACFLRLRSSFVWAFLRRTSRVWTWYQICVLLVRFILLVMTICIKVCWRLSSRAVFLLPAVWPVMLHPNWALHLYHRVRSYEPPTEEKSHLSTFI